MSKPIPHQKTAEIGTERATRSLQKRAARATAVRQWKRPKPCNSSTKGTSAVRFKEVINADALGNIKILTEKSLLVTAPFSLNTGDEDSSNIPKKAGKPKASAI
jgi:hypothetical protein